MHSFESTLRDQKCKFLLNQFNIKEFKFSRIGIEDSDEEDKLSDEHFKSSPGEQITAFDMDSRVKDGRLALLY